MSMMPTLGPPADVVSTNVHRRIPRESYLRADARQAPACVMVGHNGPSYSHKKTTPTTNKTGVWSADPHWWSAGGARAARGGGAAGRGGAAGGAAGPGGGW